MQRELFDVTSSNADLAERVAKPLFRFTNLALAHCEVGNYILQHHNTVQDTRLLTRLMVLGDSPKSNELEGLTNTTAGLLLCAARQSDDSAAAAQLESFLEAELTEQQLMMFSAMAVPAAQASLNRRRNLTPEEFQNAVSAGMAMMH